MDQLALHSPEAHAHIQTVPTELQETMGEYILKLSHAGLLRAEESVFGDTEYTHIPAEEYTEEHNAHQNRVSDIMSGTASLISEASTELTSAKPVNEIFGSEVLERAASIGVKKAKELHEQGDTEASAHEIRSVLAIHMLSGYESDSVKDAIRDVVSSNMTEELVSAITELDGVVALASHGKATDVGSIVRSTQPLIELATDTVFDDRMRHPEDISNRKLTESDQDYLQAQVNKLQDADFAALAELRNTQGKKEEAEKLASAALSGLVDRSSQLYRTSDAVRILTAASKILESGEVPSEQLQSSLDRLRSLREPGRREYRSNNHFASVMDGVIVELSRSEEHAGLIRGLLSSTPYEVPSSTVAHGESNLGRRFHYVNPPMSETEIGQALNLLQKIHQEKMEQFRESLLANGATENTVSRVLASALDPDTALKITPEFWDKYNSLTYTGIFGTERSNMPIITIIERNAVSDLAVGAMLVEALISKDAVDESIVDALTSKIMLASESGTESEYINRFITAVAMVDTLQAQILEKNPYSSIQQHKSHTLRQLAVFANPDDALLMAQRLYGDSALGKLGNIENLAKSLSGGSRSKLIELGPKFIDTVNVIFEVSELPLAIVSDTDLVKKMIDGFSVEECKALLQQVEGSPVLSSAQAMLGSGLILSLAVYSIDKTPFEELKAIEEKLSYDGLGELLGVFESQLAQSLFLKDIINKSRTSETFIAQVVNELSDDSVLAVLKMYPENHHALLTRFSQENYDTGIIHEIVDILQTDEFVELQRFVGPEHAEKVLRTTVFSKSPRDYVKQVINVYMETDFIQERVPDIDFISHAEAWSDFIEAIPDGNESKRFKAQVLSRLTLGHGESPEQAVRIFTDIKPDIELATTVTLGSRELLHLLYQAETLRGFPSANPTKLKNIFIDDELQEVYQKLFTFKSNGDVESARELMNEIGVSDSTMSSRPLTEVVGALKDAVTNYKEEERRAKAWVRDYSGQDIKAVKLIEAWKSRSLALANGAKDNPTDILNFVAENGVRVYYDQIRSQGITTVTEEELISMQSVTQSIGSRYSPEVTFRALEQRIQFERANGAYPKKLIEPTKSNLSVSGREYVAEIFSADDPRGFTIGYDTGCCMTLGGASESCIWAGFEDPRYMFFGVYENGRLRAQSVMYIAETEQGKVIVVDNIEANEGTDLSTITDVYKAALTDAVLQQNLDDVSAIHIGTGYTPTEALERLELAEIAPTTPRANVYTDARSQRVLWRR